MSEHIALSERELEVLRLVAAGASNNEIAHKLIISPNTVKVHVRNIYSKLGVLSRTDASMEAIRRGLITVPGMAVAVVKQPEPVFEPDSAPTLIEPAEELLLNDEITANEAPSVEIESLIAPAPEPTPVAEPAPIVAIAPEQSTVQPAITHVAIPRRIALLISALLAVLVVGVLVIGLIVVRGGNPTITPTANATVLPRVEDVWKPLAAVPQPLRDAAGTLYGDDEIYLTGGTTSAGVSAATWRYTLSSGRWDSRAPKPTPATSVRGSVIRNQLYVPGGVDGSGTPLSTLEIYDFAADTWRSGPALPAPRAAAMVTEIDGELYVFGGHDGTNPVATTFIFNLDTNQWREGEPLPLPLRDAAIAQNPEGVFIVGGTTTAAADSLQAFRYNAGKWTQLTDLPQPRVNSAAVFISDVLYLVGGAAGDEANLAYRDDVWNKEPLATGYALSGHVLVAKQRTMYAIGGWNGTTALAEVRSWTPIIYQFIPQVNN